MRATLIGRGVAVVLGLCAIFGTVATAADGPAVYQTANIHDFPGMTNDLGGAATLLRTAQAVDVRISTSPLDHNAAYTVWWVVFNRPAARVGGCGSTIWTTLRPAPQCSTLLVS